MGYRINCRLAHSWETRLSLLFSVTGLRFVNIFSKGTMLIDSKKQFRIHNTYAQNLMLFYENIVYAI